MPIGCFWKQICATLQQYKKQIVYRFYNFKTDNIIKRCKRKLFCTDQIVDIEEGGLSTLGKAAMTSKETKNGEKKKHLNDYLWTSSARSMGKFRLNASLEYGPLQPSVTLTSADCFTHFPISISTNFPAPFPHPTLSVFIPFFKTHQIHLHRDTL